MMPISLRLLSYVPKETYGSSANASKKPNKNPLTWAQLSIHGNKPRRNNTTMGTATLSNAILGRSSICQLCNTSTRRQAKIPNCEPAGPTCKTQHTSCKK